MAVNPVPVLFEEDTGELVFVVERHNGSEARADARASPPLSGFCWRVRPGCMLLHGMGLQVVGVKLYAQAGPV